MKFFQTNGQRLANERQMTGQRTTNGWPNPGAVACERSPTRAVMAAAKPKASRPAVTGLLAGDNIFPASPNLVPSLIGNTSPKESVLKAVYNTDTKQIRVQYPATEGTHAEIAVNAGWGNSQKLIGGYLNFTGGKISSGDWVNASGLIPGTPALADEAAAATKLIMSAQ